MAEVIWGAVERKEFYESYARCKFHISQFQDLDPIYCLCTFNSILTFLPSAWKATYFITYLVKQEKTKLAPAPFPFFLPGSNCCSLRPGHPREQNSASSLRLAPADATTPTKAITPPFVSSPHVFRAALVRIVSCYQIGLQRRLVIGVTASRPICSAPRLPLGSTPLGISFTAWA